MRRRSFLQTLLGAIPALAIGDRFQVASAERREDKRRRRDIHRVSEFEISSIDFNDIHGRLIAQHELANSRVLLPGDTIEVSHTFEIGDV